MEMNVENTLLALNESVQTIIVDDDGNEKTFIESPVLVLLDLINSNYQKEITVFTIGCGRALAYLSRLLKIKAIYALKMSKEATQLLSSGKTSYFYSEKIRLLMNGSDDDLDIYDKATITSENENEAYLSVNKVVAEKRIKEFWEAKRNGALSYTAIIDISNGRNAISSLYDSYSANNKRLPRKKDKMIGVDEHGMPVAILENIEINITPLKNIDEELTMKEGLTLEEWRNRRIPILYKEAENIGLPVNEDLWVLFEIFKRS